MPVAEIRDTIEGAVMTDDVGKAYLTRRINLEEGFRYEMLAVDVFDDNGFMQLNNGTPDDPNAAYQLYVSPYPMQEVGGDWGFAAPLSIFPGGGQAAGEPNVLYKEIGVTALNSNNPAQTNKKLWITRFPNDSVAARSTTTWFTPHVYITVMFWNAPLTELKCNYSVYLKVNKKRTGAVSQSMGRYAEFLDSQIKKLVDTAVLIPTDQVAGYTFPMWKYGGIRPEFMVTGRTALKYFNRAADNASQEMISRGSWQTGFQLATQMAEYDAAFGDNLNNLPEWITLMDVGGVTAGPIRPYAPPLKFSDNGNTLMF